MSSYISFLQDICFSLEPGETVALVGPSGGGKSTIISMIERFYDPIEGSISIGMSPWLNRAAFLVVEVSQ